ncbi:MULTISPECIES: hypothetical protein [unclassified Streptomyces]|uniref:hypothetical protein n=1 Tax=unclassified Streptomyces TaxID=2593676 RepID=UPI00342BD0C5
MHRRQFIVGLGSLVALPTLPDSGRLGMSDIARIRNAENQLLQLDDRYGSEKLAGVAGHYIDHIEGAMRRCTFGGTVQTHLHRTLGEMAAMAGWLCYDSDRHNDARRWWDTGLRYALLARSPELQARIWSYMSRQAVDLGHASEAVAIARAALDATRSRRHAHLSALLHARVALGLSALGEASRYGQAMHRAEQAIDRETDVTTPPWLAFVGHAEVLAQRSLCEDQLGAHRRAVEVRREVVALRGPDFQRNRVGDHVHLAECLLSAGDPEAALAAGHQALDFLPEVHSPRWTARLRRFEGKTLALSVSGAEGFADRYRMVSA